MISFRFDFNFFFLFSLHFYSVLPIIFFFSRATTSECFFLLLYILGFLFMFLLKAKKKIGKDMLCLLWNTYKTNKKLNKKEKKRRKNVVTGKFCNFYFIIVKNIKICWKRNMCCNIYKFYKQLKYHCLLKLKRF